MMNGQHVLEQLVEQQKFNPVSSDLYLLSFQFSQVSFSTSALYLRSVIKSTRDSIFFLRHAYQVDVITSIGVTHLS